MNENRGFWGFFRALYQRLFAPTQRTEIDASVLHMAIPVINPVQVVLPEIVPLQFVPSHIDMLRLLEEQTPDIRQQLISRLLLDAPAAMHVALDPDFIRRSQEEARRTWQQAQHQFKAEKIAGQDTYADQIRPFKDQDVDPDFICTISLEIMMDPVYDPAYPLQHYDFPFIAKWLAKNPTNPFTRTPLCLENLVHDHVLKSRIDSFMMEFSSKHTVSP